MNDEVMKKNVQHQFNFGRDAIKGKTQQNVSQNYLEALFIKLQKKTQRISKKMTIFF